MSQPDTTLNNSIGLLLGCHLSFSSYFILGLQEFSEAHAMRFDLRSPRSPRDFSTLISRVGPDYRPSILLVRYSTGPATVFAAIDTADSSNPAFQYSYRRDVLPFVDIYFKANLDRESLKRDSFLRQYDQKIFDLPFSFMVKPHRAAEVLTATSMRTGIAATLAGFVDAVRTFRTMTPLSYFDKVRDRKKIRDFTFLVTYYDHPDHKHINEYRLELIRKLREDPSLNGIAAFASRASTPAAYSPYTLGVIPLRKLLNMYAESRVAIYVRGLHDCLSFKLGQYLALGMPIAGQNILLDNHFAQSIPNLDAQFNCASPDDIVRNLKMLLNSPPGTTAAIGRANLEYFKNHTSPIRTAEHIVSTMKSYSRQ